MRQGITVCSLTEVDLGLCFSFSGFFTSGLDAEFFSLFFRFFFLRLLLGGLHFISASDSLSLSLELWNIMILHGTSKYSNRIMKQTKG